MANEITADFEKRYDGGPSICAALRIPLGSPHVTVLFGPFLEVGRYFIGHTAHTFRFMA